MVVSSIPNYYDLANYKSVKSASQAQLATVEEL